MNKKSMIKTTMNLYKLVNGKVVKINISPMSDFSNNREIVSGVWVDNKPIYTIGITVTGGSGTNQYHTLLDISSLNIDSLIKIYGSARVASRAIVPINSYINTTDSSMGEIFVYADKNSLLKESHNKTSVDNAKISLVLEYTKTTD